MEKLSMKTMDIGFQTAGKMKKPNQTADVSGECKGGAADGGRVWRL